MRAWMFALLGLFAGCDRVFGLDDRAHPDAAGEACPASYSAVAGATQLYRAASETATWRDAEADCENDSETHITHLVTWSSVAELHALQAAYGTQFNFIRVHVGYARNLGAPPLQKDSFVAVTGEPAPLDSWAVGEPNNQNLSGPETTTSVTGVEDLADDFPGVVRPYVCSCDGKIAAMTFDF